MALANSTASTAVILITFDVYYIDNCLFVKRLANGLAEQHRG
jgi:hypothetical protein